jgi:thioredoxin 1
MKKHLFGSLIIFLSMSQLAFGLDKETFTQARFEQLQAAGEVVLVDVYASWCPTCKKQHEILGAYRAANPDKNLHVLQVDFDKDKKTVLALKAPRQSTLYLFHGDRQLWFSVAETDAGVIHKELNKAFAAKAKKASDEAGEQ